MVGKMDIFDKIDQYSVGEIVDFIKRGIVTYDELCTETGGNFSRANRIKVKKAIEGAMEDDWQRVKASHSIEQLESYLITYPSGKHYNEGFNLIGMWKDEASRKEENDEWKKVDQNSIKELQKFCETYPDSPHCDKARQRIEQIDKDNSETLDSIRKCINDIYAGNLLLDANKSKDDNVVTYLGSKRIANKDLLQLIKEDNNIIGAHVLKELLKEGKLSRIDLKNIGINENFLQALNRETSAQVLPAPTRSINSISKLSTEVYFWGIPTSGKTCALGAIMSVANNGKVAMSMSKDPNCQGYDYMNSLSELFNSSDVCLLPEGTKTTNTYEMAFDLYEDTKRYHPITCIDLAGELVRCMYKYNAGKKLTNAELITLDSLTKVLIDNRSKNRKIHFFVLEYGAEDKKYDGLSQRAYLDAASVYIENYGVFSKDTDAIYLMVTKSDKANATKEELQEKLDEYIKNTYEGFYNSLIRICKNNEICGGDVRIIPFSLGQICFKHYCLFNKECAEGVVKLLLSRTKDFKAGRLAKFINKIKG